MPMMYILFGQYGKLNRKTSQQLTCPRTTDRDLYRLLQAGSGGDGG